jgi:predicted nucleic acid-binding protein
MRRVYLDACIVIYLIEKSIPFSEKTRQFFALNRDAHLCVSPLVRMEVILKPLRESATTLVSDYEDFLAAQHWLTIDDGTFNRALHLRAHHGLKTPDSIHLATALNHGCKEFWTNDDRLNKAVGIMSVNIFSN